VVHDQHVVGLLLDDARDALPVLRPENQRLEDEQVERPLQVWGGEPIGRQLWLEGTAYEIVGVAADDVNAAFHNHDRDPKVYLPLTAARTDRKQMEFLIRASGDPARCPARSVARFATRWQAASSPTPSRSIRL
jgi:hypothetical protein